MHIVLSDGLRVGIKSLMATVRGPGLKYCGVSSQQGLGTTGGLAWRVAFTVVSGLPKYLWKEI